VQPSIFGSLLEGGLGHDKQWALGAHYTHEADIQKVVQPTIVQPWLERIDALAKHKDAVAAHYDLLNYVVLDPACGSGNFLYVAYRELRRLEVRLLARLEELREAEGRKELGTLSLFPLSNLKGIEIDGFAVALARVTLWMGHKLAVDELELAESTLPLADLSGIKVGDALRLKWPRADAIIGNPPFHGANSVRSVLGDDYVEWLKSRFGAGLKDLCVYWFRKAHDSLSPGDRAGLVGTNSISQNLGRSASLAYIAERGGVGVLSSALHHEWARQQSSTLEDRFRYTPTSAFETFPWPSGNHAEIADVSRRLYARRSEICLERQIGLTKLYNQLDDGAWRDLADLHAELDEVVAAAYGWPRAVAHDTDETNRRLLELNRVIAAGEADYHPFG